jgi:uncharacterized protein involved in cysteine biosynthesis
MKLKSVSYLRPLDRLPPAKESGKATAARPSLLQRLARWFDRVITVYQEWLEDPDRLLSKIFAAAVLLLFFAYLIYHLAGWLCPGG